MERVKGDAITVNLTGRRDGDPAAIVAGASRVREILGWQPRHANLDFIVKSALDWERKLIQRNAA